MRCEEFEGSKEREDIVDLYLQGKSGCALCGTVRYCYYSSAPATARNVPWVTKAVFKSSDLSNGFIIDSSS